MAKNKIIRCLQAGLLSAAIAVALPACTDDHYDVQNGGDIDGNATKTLWEQIESNPSLSRFATIAQKTPYFKDESHPVAGYTFKDVLSGSQILTVFAPTNDAFTDAEYEKLLQDCESDPYDVYLRLVGNHITRNRLVAAGTGEPEEIVMLNSKRAIFDRQNKKFKDIDLYQANIPAINGTLHTIQQQSPFSYNIYEYVKSHGDTYGQLRKWLVEHDTIYFMPSLSAEGGSDADGNPIYVDSVYFRQNTLSGRGYNGKATDNWIMMHKGFGASLESEDSVYAMILPTDAAWNAAFERMKKYYVYAPSYINKATESNSNGQTVGTDLSGDPDSLQELAIRMDLASPLLFNVRQQKRLEGQTSYWTAEQFNSTPMAKIFNARSDTFRINKDLLGDIKAIITDGNTSPVEVSNGILYPVDNWRFWENYANFDVNIKVSRSQLFMHKDFRQTTKFQYVTFNNATSALSRDSLLGKVSDNSFYYISYGTAAPEVWFKLYDRVENHQVMSNVAYDIQLVLVPTFFRLNPDSIIGEDADYPIKKNKLRVQILYNNGNHKAGRSDDLETKRTEMVVEYDGTRVDTITVNATPFTFPYTYKNLDDSYPLIHITSAATNTEVKKGYQHPFAIDRIILKARDEE